MAQMEEESYTCEESFATRLSSLPLIQSTKECYNECKEGSTLFNIGSTMVEYGLGAVTWTTKPLQFGLSTVFKSQATRLECVASHCLDTIEDNYPVTQQPVKKIGKRIKRRMMGYVNSGTQAIMTSSLGQGAINGLDVLVTASEVVLNKIAPCKSPDTHNSTIVHSPLNDKNPTIQASVKEDEKKAAVPEKTEASIRSPIESLSEHQQSEDVRSHLLTFATYPLRCAVEILKAIQDFLHQMEYGKVWSSTHVSPQKLAEIQRRRKVSPKKRLPKRPFYQRLAGAVLSVFSFGQGKMELSKPVRIRRQLGSEEGEFDQRPCSASDDAERKRKHDDIESESDSEYSDGGDFYDVDDDYVSEEDPDYEPSREGIADDSLEYQEGETESDVDLQEDDMSPAATRTRYQNRKTKSGSSQNEKKKGTTPKKGEIVNSKHSKQKEQAKPVKAAADSNTSPKVTSTSNSVDFPPLSHVTVNGHK